MDRSRRSVFCAADCFGSENVAFRQGWYVAFFRLKIERDKIKLGNCWAPRLKILLGGGGLKRHTRFWSCKCVCILTGLAVFFSFFVADSQSYSDRPCTTTSYTWK